MGQQASQQLIRHTTESYGDSFKAHLFEQYKHYVDSAQKVSERRVSANNYLLTVNAFLVAFYGLVAASQYRTYWAVLAPVAGLVVSVTWFRIIKSYRDLNTVKFKVIHELEQHMPASPYDYEWKKAEEGRGRTYHALSHLEGWVPITFMVLYVLLGALGFLGLVK